MKAHSVFLSAVLFSLMFLVGCHHNESSDSETDTTAQSVAGKTILAVYAHPDDETTVGPLLAKFANEGATVYLAIVTDGRWGGATNDTEANALALARAAESQCATSALGIEEPILMEFEDGETPENIYTIKAAVATLFADIEPDIVLTWGLEGGYGHKDHRMVSTIVSDVFQAGSPVDASWPETLYYAGVPESQVQGFTPTSAFGGTLQVIWGTTEEKYLQYTISVDESEIDAAKTAAACHVSQWDAAALSDVNALLDASLGTVYLRKSHIIGENKSHID